MTMYAIILGSAAVTKQGNQGVAQLTTIALTSGAHSITAYFSGHTGVLAPSKSSGQSVTVNSVPSALFNTSNLPSGDTNFLVVADE